VQQRHGVGLVRSQPVQRSFDVSPQLRLPAVVTDVYQRVQRFGDVGFLIVEVIGLMQGGQQEAARGGGVAFGVEQLVGPGQRDGQRLGSRCDIGCAQ
jgi:hypothetical protein